MSFENPNSQSAASQEEESRRKAEIDHMAATMSDEEVFGEASRQLAESDAEEAEAKRKTEINRMAATMSDQEVFGSAMQELKAEEASENARNKNAQIEHMIDTMTDQEIFDMVEAKIEREEAQENAESRETNNAAPVIEIAGKRIQVDAYTETWQDAARKYREQPRAVEKQMIQISHDLELLTTQVQQVTDRMMRMQESNAEGESVLNAEQQARITEKLLAFQPLHEYNAIFTNAEQTLEEVKKILIDAERQAGMEQARNVVSGESNS